MSEEKRKQSIRSFTILGIFVCIVVFFIFILFNTQIVNGNEYLAKSIASNAESETVKASRGVITDRNGKVLVSNRVTYTLSLDGSVYEDQNELNNTILHLISLCNKYNCEWTDSFPISEELPFDWKSFAKDENFESFVKKTKITENQTATSYVNELCKYFLVNDALSGSLKRQVVGARYELTLHTSFVFSEDVSVELISEVVDANLLGVSTGTSSARTYSSSAASHILGRVSRIYAEDWDQYSSLGYSMDAIVGESGAEKAFEQYLAGKNGTRLITTDKNGRITSELYTVEPQPGATVALTIDIDFQTYVEEALASTITKMDDENTETRGGAVAVVEVGSGEILALASYPTYDLSTFAEDYSDLINDPRLPLFNRATSGTYAPGSTFKMVTAVAALENGVITPGTYLYDYGVYKYYDDPQPQCWLWRQSHTSHGYVNVTDAIEVSCNYFFYEVGRLTGIDTINAYASQFGLGVSTGVEIGDVSGSIASEVYARSNGLEWTEGQTLTAAIGQSYNLFTPLQLANYIATLAGDGEHYAAHILKSVRSYDNSAIVYLPSEEPINTVAISDTTKSAVLSGMRALATGSLKSTFDKCVVKAACKTGSAQVGTDIANGVFVAYAPYDNPEIAVAIVIEKGGSGAALASTAVDIINAYFTSSNTNTTILSEGVLIQ